jgi:peroxisomal 3,2-trans-enoyl-CoA isomerase
MADQFVLGSKDASTGIYTITLNRPKQGNALAMRMYASIISHLDAAEKDSSVRAVVVTGAGKFFSTGADVAEAAQSVLAGGDIKDLTASLYSGPVRLTQKLIDFPKLAVAFVNGPVVGYPAAQLGVYDLVYVSDSATYQLPFLQLGIAPEACSSVTLPATVGVSTANDLLLHGRVLKAAELVSLGIASRQFPAATFNADASAELLKALKASSPNSILASKALLRAPMKSVLTDANKREADALCARFESGEPAKRFAKVFSQISAKNKKSKL